MAAQEDHTAIVSTLSLEENCALDIYSYFMIALAKNITKIGGTTNIVVQSTPHTPHIPTHAAESEDGLWVNSVVEAMVSIVVDSELTDRTTAYTVIIPALHLCDLLPTDIPRKTDERSSADGSKLYRAPSSDESSATK